MGAHGMKFLGLALAWLVTFAASGALASGPPVTTRWTQDGLVFATAAGMTLYTWTREDSAPGKSLCTNERYAGEKIVTGETMPYPAADKRKTCIDKWFALAAAPDATPQGLWSLVARYDGSKQWAYDGHPLYASNRDIKPGDVNGLGYSRRGLEDSWRPALAPLDLPPGLKLIRRPEGLVLALDDGRPLYVRQGVQRVCSGCAEPEPLRASALARPRDDWSIVDAGYGRKQYAFKGQALYMSPTDVEDGEVERGWAVAVYRPAPQLPSDITTGLSILGGVYTDRKGMTLYVFSCGMSRVDGVACDDPGDAAASWSLVCGLPEECDKQWRLYRAAPTARSVGEWSVVDVASPIYGDPRGLTYLSSEAPARIKAWAWRGRPAYTFVGDEYPAQILGHSLDHGGQSGFNAIRVVGAQVEN